MKNKFKHFSRLWKKWHRNTPLSWWRKSMFGNSKSSGGGRREELRKAKHSNRDRGNLNRKPLPRQTKQHRSQGR
jgi:hypothetical protein